LEDDEFRVREAASGQLEKVAEAALPFLQRHLEAITSPEVRRRLEAILERRAPGEAAWTPEQARVLRAIRVLEQIGTPQARQALAALAGEALHADLVREAEAARDRLPVR
jgi:hypothetical protein